MLVSHANPRLWIEKKQTRHDLGREAFVAEIWKWKEKYAHGIYEQFRRLGTSFDWDRVAFTMDPKLSKAVRETFVRLHDEGVIYRANRLVNWCVRLNTALSNLEVDNLELTGRTLLSVPGYNDEKFEFGVIVQFAYQVEDSGGVRFCCSRFAMFMCEDDRFKRRLLNSISLSFILNEKIVVATTRVETMLGDSAIAVHSQDERYKNLHNKYVIQPFSGRRIPIIIDDVLVDPTFGTGAVKITPAHDFNDYEVGKRHNLEFINILNDDGTFNENAVQFKGYRRFHARKAVIEALKEKGLYIDTKDNIMTVPICSKSGDIIEPLMKPQWWINCKDMANAAMEAVTEGKLKVQPKTSEQEWFRWLENIQDWCVSRQLWWGHRVPVYFVRLEGVETQDSSDNQYWVSGQDESIAFERAKAKFPGQKFTLEQDPDVLDTWFSSGLWPFSIFGWPEDVSVTEAICFL
ncbi:LOW QUALITY PROTEIN: Aminoacyl-tRNA synthetase [Jimgerdemannia flammicorona]|uniref:valine--tRNA ligase n=1 Tax=Jimgerdemannia flammicorona TaxID=994334 RepID=A0A433CZT4_9FUNG|nr:LOW QUALITY PROTEIN: Aminoacyl-tRNA synthetase [Jimgerdemannia flammicorona]